MSPAQLHAAVFGEDHVGKMPGMQEGFDAYLTGEPILAPCGREVPCEEFTPSKIGALEFCVSCRMRVER